MSRTATRQAFRWYHSRTERSLHDSVNAFVPWGVPAAVCLSCTAQKTCQHYKGGAVTEAASLEDREEAWLQNLGSVCDRITVVMRN